MFLCRPALSATLALFVLVLTPGAPFAAEIVTVSPEFLPPDGGGLSDPPRDFVVHGGRLVMHGPFSSAGTSAVEQGPVAWTGSGFSTTGLPANAPDDPLTLHAGSLVFGASVWDGATLQPLVGTETFEILDVAASVSGPSGLALVADIEPDPDQHLRRDLILWDGTQWQIQATFGNRARAVVEFDGAWFLANNYSIYPETSDPAPVLRFDGSWSSYPEISAALDLAVIDGQLLLATFDGLYVYDGAGWDLVPTTEGSEFHDLIEWNGNLLVSGKLGSGLCGGEACNVAAWDGSQWSALPRVGHRSPRLLPDLVSDLVVFDGELYAGGTFTKGSQPEPARHVARLVGSQWLGLETEIGFGIDEPVRSFGFYDGAPIASLSHFAEGPTRDATYRLQDNGWWQFSSSARDGANDYVETAAGLVAGGFVSLFPDTDAIVERWSGTSWELLARGEANSGLGAVNAVTVYDGQLVVAGDFDSLNLLPYRSIATHDGNQWQSLGAGINGIVHDLIVFEGDLVVIGDFFDVSGQEITHVARWDGTQWSAMGEGFTTYGLSLAIADSTLYAGGALQWSGSNPTPYLARWNGAAWQGVPDPPDKIVTDMAGIAGGLYLAGNFTEAGGVAVNGFAKLVHATQSWEAPEFLPDGKVLALLRQGSDLYVGGEFTQIQGDEGPVPAQYVGRVRFESGVDTPPAVASVRNGFRRIYPNPANPRVNLQYELGRAGRVEILLYDTRGRLVRHLLDRHQTGGIHRIQWNGLDDGGQPAASGVYLARLRAPDGSGDVRKIVLAR